MNNGNNNIVAGSLGAVTRKSGSTIAQSFLNVKCLVMVDVSGSMHASDTGSGSKTRYDLACEQLAHLQTENPGEIGVCSFSGHADFCPGGVPVYQGGSTDMAAAVRMLKMADGCGIRLVLISDGEPDNEQETLRLAAGFTSRIDTIFVGPENGHGRDFLRKLSAATGGISITNAAAELGRLGDNITKLISAGA